ncbi:MAG: hypothetical protein KGS28_11435 [Betaproteobacteria bacterium]|nr:hypothetical protein [Betaproteobacteria bacterium]
MKRIVGTWRALRGLPRALRRLATACALLVSKAASAAWFLFSAAMLGSKAWLATAAGSLGSSVLTGVMVVGGAYIGYKLLHAEDPARRAIEFVAPAHGGGVTKTVVKLGGSGENNTALAHYEGLPATPSSRPAPGVASMPAANASAPAASAPGESAGALVACGAACKSPASLYQQALALSAMVHWDDRVNRLMGWPVVSYCRKGVQSLNCGHNDLWLRNDAPVAIHGARICVARDQEVDFVIAGAGPGDCLRADIPAGRDLHIAITQRSRNDDYPSYRDLFLDLSLPEWNMGARLKRLPLPVLRPLSFFPLGAPTPGDSEHEIGVQARRVNLLAQMIVFTYHGSGDGYLEIVSRKLGDPKHAMHIVDAREHPAAYRALHLTECLPGAGMTVLASSRLAAGESCGVLVHAEDVHQAPYTHDTARSLEAQLRMKFLQSGHTGTKAVVRKLRIVMQHEFLAGGDFRSGGSMTNPHLVALPHVARISGSILQPLPGLFLAEQGSVRALGLTPDATRLCIGGRFASFTGAGGQAAQTYLACQSGGDTWSYAEPENGPDAMVRALTPDAANGMLYVGGSFEQAAGIAAPGIAALQVPDEDHPVLAAENWRPLGGGVMDDADLHAAGTVDALLVQPDGRLVVGGSFYEVVPGEVHAEAQQQAEPEPLESSMLAWWNPQTQLWEPGGEVGTLGNLQHAQPAVRALAWYHGALMVGGLFSFANHAPEAGVPQHIAVAGWARFDAQQPEHPWTRVAPAAQGKVLAFTHFGQGLVAGGQFRITGAPRSTLLRVGDDLAHEDLQPQLLPPPPEVPASALQVRALAASYPMLCMGGHFAYTSGGALGGNLACRDVLTGQDQLAGRAVNGDVRALLPYWEMEVDTQPAP